VHGVRTSEEWLYRGQLRRAWKGNPAGRLAAI